MNHSARFSGDPMKLLGAAFVVTTQHGKLSGELFCYDVGPLQRVVIKHDNKDGTADFHVVLLSSVRQVTAEGVSSMSSAPSFDLLDRELLEKREQLALEAFEKRRNTVGVGVTEDQQKLFDMLEKNFPPAEWQGKTISLLGGEVKLVPPYTIDCIEGDVPLAKERAAHVLKQIQNGY